MRIISATRSRVHWDARSATSSRFRFAVFIIAGFTRHGGQRAWWGGLSIDPDADCIRALAKPTP